MGHGERIGRLAVGLDCDLAIWDIDAPADLVYRIGFNPLHARVVRGQPTCLPPGATHEQHPGSSPRPCHACPVAAGLSRYAARARPGRAAGGCAAAAVAAIVAPGAPVHGINTGFGSGQRAHRAREDLAISCSGNIVLSHAAGVGEPMPASVVRLMMALKLVSLAQGASASARKRLLLEAMLVKGVLPVVPAQGSVGASGDLAPLRTRPA